jgi:hypothetical protein
VFVGILGAGFESFFNFFFFGEGKKNWAGGLDLAGACAGTRGFSRAVGARGKQKKNFFWFNKTAAVKTLTNKK